ncbi:MAG: NCS2 family permease [Bacillota bacterium]|jgi:AGZA family xanthine/uracil permease-like MFS transporter
MKPEQAGQAQLQASGFLERTFRLTENNTNVRTEFIGALTTWIASVGYIILIYPAVLSNVGVPKEGVFLSAIIATLIGTLCMAFTANYPFIMGPGAAHAAFFTFTVCIGMNIPWQIALGMVFIEGVIFIIISVLPIREAILNCIPMGLKNAISVGIGFFIAFIGMNTTGIIVGNEATLVAIGDLTSPAVIISLLALLIMVVLHSLKIQGALLLGIVGATIVGALPWFNVTSYQGIVSLPPVAEWLQIAFQLDIVGALKLSYIPVIFAFLFVDIFDTAGTLVGASAKAGFLDEKGNLPRAGQAFLSDAIGTTAGALMGSSTVTTYLESAVGVVSGARTGLTALFFALFMAGCIFFSPLVMTIPAAATFAALIMLGALMMSSITKINWDDFTEVFPAFVVVMGMPLTYSISNGIGLGFISYAAGKLFTGRGKEVHWLVYILAGLFVIYFAFLGVRV